MYISLRFRTIISILLVIVLAACIFSIILPKNDEAYAAQELIAAADTPQKYIKWVDFQVPYDAMNTALNLDIKSQTTPVKMNWIELLSYLGAKYGGNFKKYKAKDLQDIANKLKKGDTIQNITKDMKYYNYFYEAYDSIFKEFVGTYKIQVKNSDGEMEWQTKYGLKVFSPIAKGFGYSHYDDFGNSRSYGYKRIHLGNDILGSIGTPIVAVESGTIEVMGWNMYGGWRIGIRSYDKKRYYYYAHMRKDHPFNSDLYEGKRVTAGDVIGYLGMTGYSTKENVNNITKPHLHFGMQLIFDESQKEGVNQIWVDVYNIFNLLQKNKSQVVKDSTTKEYNRVFQMFDQTQE
jgi:murein DD-endopeptidase MepM/ murein hydrolase activator NlpD